MPIPSSCSCRLARIGLHCSKLDEPWDDTLWDCDFSVNQAGVALSTSIINLCDVVGATCPGDPEAELDQELDVTTDFSTDLTNWRTIEGLED